MPMLPRKNMRTEMLLVDRWVDISDDVREPSGVNITYGSSSQDRAVPPATAKAVLENESDKFSRRNPLSPNYGKLGENTPVRVTNMLSLDRYDRVLSGDWGTTTSGDRWNLGTTPSSFAVGVTGGTVVVSATSTSRIAYLPEQRHKNVDVAITFSLGLSNVTGGDLEPANIVLRGASITDYLMVRVVITSAEAITIKVMHQDGTSYSSPVTIPITFSGQTLRLRTQAEGSVVRAKLWVLDTSVADSDGEPESWPVEARVPDAMSRVGWVGVRSGVGGGNTNIPVTFTYRDFEVRSNRFIGEAAVMAPRWNRAETDRVVSLDGAGLLQRLQKGSSPLKSTLRRSVPALPDIVAYWPMEDGSDATSFASGLVDGLAMRIDPNGDQSLASFSGFPSSQPIPTINAGLWAGDIRNYTNTGEVQTRFLMRIPDGGITNNNPICRLRLLGGTLDWFDIRGGSSSGELRIVAHDGSVDVLNTNIGFAVSGKNMRVSMELKQNGANIDWGLWVLEVGASSGGGFTGTINNHTLGTATRLDFSVYFDLNGTAIGHATVEKKVTSIFDLLSQLNAYNGETATDRMVRLCQEEGVAFSLNGAADADAKMGFQRSDTLPNLLKECADLDMGILGESRGRIALKYRTRLSMLGQVPVVSIDRTAGQLSDPFSPVDDNRLTANDVTAERVNGSSFRVEQTTGPMSTQNPPAGAGRVPATPKFVATSDLQLPDLAGWTLSLGTVDEYRYPSVTADMAVNEVEKDADLVAGLLSLDIGDVVEVVNLSPLGIYDAVLQVAHGYTEGMYPYRHTIQANTFPASPYNALKLDDAVLGKMDSASSTVGTGFSATAGSFSVATSDVFDLWTTDGAEFPIDVMIAGERIRLSAISGASSPQTFTVAAGGRSINGVVKAHAAGEAVHIATPVKLA